MSWFDEQAAGPDFQAGPGQRLTVQAGGGGVVTGDKTGGYYQGPLPQHGEQLSGSGQPPQSSSPGGAVGRVDGGTMSSFASNPQPGVNYGLHGGDASQQQGGGQPFDENLFWQIKESFPPTNEGMRAAEAELNRVFGANAPKLLDHPLRLDKFVFPDGRTFDAIIGAGGANPSHGRMLEGPGHGGGGGAAGAAGAMAGGNWQAGMDPSYQFRFDEGVKALQQSAAAKGTLLTGGVQKALLNYGQNAASQEFGNIFGRNAQLAGMGLNAAQTAAASGTAYSGQAGNTAQNYANTQGNLVTGRGNATAAGQAGRAGMWGNTIAGIGAGIAGSYIPGSGGGGGGTPGAALPPGYNYNVPYPNSPMM